MKKIYLIVYSLVFALCLLMPAQVGAQVDASVVDSSVSVSPAIRSAVDAWLGVHPPAPHPYYVITYVNPRSNGDVFVSLAALTQFADGWHITDNTVAWMGSVLVAGDDVTLLTKPRKFSVKFAAPAFAGGSSQVIFPWEAGKKMMYGESAVHAAGGGGAYAVGFDAVDFLGGSDLGSGVATNKVYAAYAGTVDYVCEDGTTTLIRTDDGSGNRFIYAHLLDNANLIEDHDFTRGQMVGSLKFGTFDDTCGWAEQTELHYHLHFGFEMDSGHFRIQNCILAAASEDWACGSTTVSPGEYLTSTNSGGGGGSGNTASNASFWDMVIDAFQGVWDTMILANLPTHKALEFTYVIMNAVVLVLKIAWVMVYSNVNLGHLAAVILFGLLIKGILSAAEFIVFLFKAYNTIFPKAPFIG